MKLTFLGSGSAFTVGTDNYQSNILLESPNKKRLLVDCGTDIRFALFDQGYSHSDISAVFVSHLHADHVGGMEWFGYKCKFDPKIEKKPDLFISKTMVDDIWNKVLSGGMSSLADVEASLSTYFDVHPVGDDNQFTWEGAKFELVSTIHCMNGLHLMPTYGLLITIGKKKVWITSDSQFTPDILERQYAEADLIFQDCEISAHPTGVHAHYKQLKTLPAEIKKKMWLYHYNTEPLPDAVIDGFLGFVKKGQVFNI